VGYFKFLLTTQRAKKFSEKPKGQPMQTQAALKERKADSKM
jgi:hypothetical protein